MRQHLLLIEDDARLAAMVSEYLEGNGFTVSRAGSGLELGSEERFYLIVSLLISSILNWYNARVALKER